MFVDEDPATVAAIADELALDYVQLHGKEAPAVVESFGPLAIKAHRLPKDGDLYGATILLDRHFHAAPTPDELREHWALARSLGADRRVLLARRARRRQRRRRHPHRPAVGGGRRPRHRVGAGRQGP